ncbi:MAG: Glu-tRNA(Gln) amidotransferase GatDE subunit E, partial [Candidatus Aminicenantes bacterium]|nr:Glu-tRNA(Gln) amidotransferase GatDE subunit E [Candidatus Aminicenantes bacterium]
NREALEIALEISLLCKMNIVGEVHIMRKQYLDGSIPTGFQRSAILGVEGEIRLRNKKIRLIQLSIEEDSCREVSDIRHERIYQTDRLGIPLIETVTYPDFINPDEVREGAEYIRFLNRSTGKVFVGIGSGREDVNVSCCGGSRVEIKAVAHNKWIPELTHIEVFRQWALLKIRDRLKKKNKNSSKWKIGSKIIASGDMTFTYEPLQLAQEQGDTVVAVNLPGFEGLLSHFTQPGKMFADELSDRLKVIACIEKPNMVYSEQIEKALSKSKFDLVRQLLQVCEDDAQIIIWGPEEDIPTALETIEERCQMAFEGVPRESRKSLPDGTTLFERVLPGPNRMYPDTDSIPIALADDHVDRVRLGLPLDVYVMYEQLHTWRVPRDTVFYIMRNNLFSLIERCSRDLKLEAKFVATLLGHTLKHIEGSHSRLPEFRFERIFMLLKFLKEKKLELTLAKVMLPEVYRHPQMDCDSILATLNFKKIAESDILAKVTPLVKIANDMGVGPEAEARVRWIMGELRNASLGNISLTKLAEHVRVSVQAQN